MTMTLSSATAAAKSAQAELTAPVAANTAAASNSGKSTATSAKPANSGSSSSSSANSANASKNGSKNSSTAQASSKPAATTTASQQPERNAGNSADAATLAAKGTSAAAPVSAPLFSQMLNLADVAKAEEAGSDDASKASSDDASSSGSAVASDVLPAMIASMLNATLPVQAAPLAADGDAVRTDAVSATSTLSASATRLNLAAASVAVMPATPASDAAATAAIAAAQAAATPAGSASNIYTLANNATLTAAAARQSDSDRSATPADSPAPVVEADAPAMPRNISSALPEAYASVARVAVRGADSAAATTVTPAAAAPLVVNTSGNGSTADDGNNSLSTAATSVNSINVSQTAAPATGQASATVKLAGAPDQWQQPLREALGDRLQLQLQRNSEQAVIRLEPPNMGSIEISIRHSAGALQVNLSASNSDVVRQLNNIGDSVRQDLSSRQFTDVAVTVSSSRAQAQADQGGKNGQPRDQNDGRTPGRALSEDDSTATFAMTGE
jgi:flagellar hook-length control protein FliK